MRTPVPPTPEGTTLREFGRDIMKWSTGNQAARARMSTLTKEELQEAGVTRDVAEQWRDFYMHEARRVPANPSATGRAELMQCAVELLS